MTSITVSDLHSTDVSLFLNSESFLKDLSYEDSNEVYGGNAFSYALGYLIGKIIRQPYQLNDDLRLTVSCQEFQLA